MAKITRYNGNLQAFASEALGQERVVFGNNGSPPLESDDLTTNIDSNFERGWGVLPLGNKPPREWFNSVAWAATQLSAYLHQVGVAEWDDEQEYHTGSYATREGSLYVSSVDDNVGNDPSAGGGEWSAVNSAVTTALALLQTSLAFPIGTKLSLKGFNRLGDGAVFRVIKTAGTDTPSQNPGQRELPSYTDATGAVWDIVADGPLSARAFGLFGEGEETAEFKAIAAWMQEGRKVFFIDDFTIVERVDMPSSGTLDFGDVTVDATGLPNSTVDRDLNIALNITGSVDAAAAIDADITAGDRTFTSAAASGVAAGDTVIVRSDQPFVDGWSGSVNAKRGELLTVKSVSGNDYEVEEAFEFSYASASGLVVEKMNTVSPKIYGGTFQLGGVNSEHRGVFISYGRNVVIKGTKVRGAEDTSVQLSYVHTADVDVECFDATRPTSGFNTGYGVASVDGSRNIDVRAIGHNCKHVVTAGGRLPSLETRVTGVAYDSGIDSSAWDCHEPCFGWTWDVECYGCFAGIVLRGSRQKVKIKTRNMASRSVTIKTFDNVGTQFGFDVELDTDNNASGCVLVEADLQPIDDVKLRGRVRDVTFTGIDLLGNASFGITNVALDLDVDGTSDHNLSANYVGGLSGTFKGRNAGAGDSVEGFNCSNVDLSVDVVSASGDAVYFEGSDLISLSGLRSSSSAGYAVFTDTCNNVKVTVANLETSSTNSDCWRAVDTIGGKLIGSTLTATRHGVLSSGTSDRFVIVGNDAVDVTDATKYNLSGTNNDTTAAGIS